MVEGNESCCSRRVRELRWLITTSVYLVLCMRHAVCQRIILDTFDNISTEDLEVGGACVNGCTREVVKSVAAVWGETNCELRVQNLLDHIEQDVEGGTLNIVHSCFDQNQNLQYQVGGCLACVSMCLQCGYQSAGSMNVVRRVGRGAVTCYMFMLFIDGTPH